MKNQNKTGRAATSGGGTPIYTTAYIICIYLYYYNRSNISLNCVFGELIFVHEIMYESRHIILSCNEESVLDSGIGLYV